MTAARAILILAAVWIALLYGVAQTRATVEEVEVALVLLADNSGSMDTEERLLQRQGYAEAFRSAPVKDAILGNMTGSIYVTYVEWSGPTEQRTVVGWTLIDSEAAADKFAFLVEGGEPSGFASTTAGGDALLYGLAMLNTAPFQALRRVIDYSSDGVTTVGTKISAARDEVVAAGVTINGLPVLSGSVAVPIAIIEKHFEDDVIGGIAPFMVPVYGLENLSKAVRDKLVREIAGLGRGRG